ncbi:MAG: AlpA family phage regulatory protein [Deltaproteobacteria bacterium]|jgi:prophage regulatory protein|nr:AlpA family phage regulatory protein [Deltaproteobacteria bacterium]
MTWINLPEPPKGLLSPKEVSRLTSLSRATLDKQIAAGNFPRPVRLIPGGKRIAFREAEVMDWISSRPQARGDGPD